MGFTWASHVICDGAHVWLAKASHVRGTQAASGLKRLDCVGLHGDCVGLAWACVVFIACSGVVTMKKCKACLRSVYLSMPLTLGS